MKMKEKKYNKYHFFLCLLIIPLSLLIHFVKYLILPAKYFYDSNKILALVLGYNIPSDKAFDFVSNIFKRINIFHFSTIQQWSLIITIFFSLIIFFLLLKDKGKGISSYIYIYASVVLLNIYVFNLSKDIIQFVFALILFFILEKINTSNFKKMIIMSFVLLFETLYFRTYYGIMLIIMWDFYIVYYIFSKKLIIDKNKFFKILVISFFALILQIYLIKIIFPSIYQIIISARNTANIRRENSPDAVTIINDLLDVKTNYFLFIGNYLINTIRLAIPIELTFKGIKYIPFILYQVFITYNIFKLNKKINDENILYILTLISFIMISIIFEPDFGSFVRHESAYFIFLIKIIWINNKETDISLK